MTYVYVDVRKESYSTGGYNPEDCWSRDSSDGTAEAENVYLSTKNGYDCWDTAKDVKVGDTVYVVLAVYGTGDSFGSDGGQYEVFLVTIDEFEAELKKEELEKTTDYSVPWNGYFEWLQGIEISAHEVKPNLGM